MRIGKNKYTRSFAMAGNDPISKSLQKLDEELTCPVCTEHFKEPKVLPCCHYHCKTCIADLIIRAALQVVAHSIALNVAEKFRPITRIPRGMYSKRYNSLLYNLKSETC